jgi:hypothetical protein
MLTGGLPTKAPVSAQTDLRHHFSGDRCPATTYGGRPNSLALHFGFPAAVWGWHDRAQEGRDGRGPHAGGGEHGGCVTL